MKWTESVIGHAVAHQVLDRKCIVLVPNCNWTGHECDVLGVTVDRRIIDIEVKISRADLKKDAAKDKWWHYTSWRRADAPAPREWPPKVWKHYYAMPADIWNDDLAATLPSERSGILLFREPTWKASALPVEMSVRRRAQPNRDAARLELDSVLDIARLANLRMWAALRRAA